MYTFASQLSGHRLLEIANGSTKNGGKAQLYDNNYASCQRWKIINDDTGLVLVNVRSGKVLEVPGARASRGARVKQYKSNGTAAQRWIAEQTAKGIVLHSALNKNMVLDVASANSANGAAVQLYTANGTNAQAWITTNETAALTDLAQANKGTVPDGVYGFASALTGSRLLEIAGGSSQNGGNAQTYRNNRTSAQRWQVTNDANGFLTLKNVRSGKVLDVAGASAKNGTNVQQYAANGSRAQQWIAVKTGNGIVLHSALNAKLVLDIAAGQAKDGANVQIYQENGTKAQSWSLDTSAYVRGSIESYYSRNSSWLGVPKANEQADGNYVVQEFQNGTVYSKNNGGTYAVRNNGMQNTYAEQGGPSGWLGYPISDAQTNKNRTAQQFEHGAIVRNSNGSVLFVKGEINSYWTTQGGFGGWLGWPTANEQADGNGNYSQSFDGGTVHWYADGSSVASIQSKWTALGGDSGSLGEPADKITVQTPQGYVRTFKKGMIFATSATDVSTAVVMDSNIFTYWNSKGGLKSYLGLPTGDALTVKGGVSQTFKGGTVFWSKETGAHSVRSGAFLNEYAKMKYEQGKLGFPTSEEQTIRGGKSQVFQNGQIHWSSATGAHATIGAILSYWSSRGWQNGWLGFPTGDELTVKGGVSQTFQHGTVFWSKKTNAHGVKGAILSKYANMRYEQGKLGFPTSDETGTVRGGVWQSFQNGTMYWKSDTGAHAVANGFFGWYRNDGYERGIHGFPTSDEYLDRGHARQNFEHGSYWWGGMPSGTYSFGIQWAGQPNTYYCVPTSGYMIMRNAKRLTSPNGTRLSIDAIARYMGAGTDGTWNNENKAGLNAWLGANYYELYGYPSYSTLKNRILHSYETGYAPMILEHERRGGYHPNGHPNATFSHALVLDQYNTKDDGILLVDPLASYGGKQKFWDHLSGFRNAYLTVSSDGDAPGIMATR
ncbi:RICIN domain-containing protein [Bifidobacterium aerophilum]|nr:RICIN domain-containing protein [Bifidobacterium aerophilum]